MTGTGAKIRLHCFPTAIEKLPMPNIKNYCPYLQYKYIQETLFFLSVNS